MLNFNNALRTELPNLQKTARWLTQDPHKADDLIQDTYVLALRFKCKYKDNTNLRAWLTRIMRNRHVSNLRRKTLERRIMEEESCFALTTWSIGAMGRRSMQSDGDVYVDNSFSDPVHNAMKELSFEFRNAILLCDVEGMSYTDAAKWAACPVGTIMSRLHRGRKALKKKLISRRSIETAA